MDPNLQIVAIGFRVIGLAVGFPSLISLVGMVALSIDLYRITPPDPSQVLDVQTYGLVGLVQDGAYGVAKAVAFLAGMGIWLVVGLAILAAIALLFAAIIYLTGRGIGHHATWARIVGLQISAVLLLCSFGVLLVLRRELAILAGLPIGLSLYMLWVLCWRFA